MFGNIGELASLLTNKNKLAETIKEQVPGLLQQLTAVIAAECGAAPDEPTAVVLFQAEKASGPTTMARVHRVDAFGVLGDELGTIDVPAALKSIPNEAITKLLPF